MPSDDNPAELPIQASPGQSLQKSSSSAESGLAPLLLTVVELVRQLMEAQVIRRMEADQLSEEDLERAAESLRQLEEQVVKLCDIFEIDPADLNIDLGEFGTLLPQQGGYYPGEKSENPTILEMLDRLLHTGVVVQGDLDLGLANINLIHAKLRLILTSQPIDPTHRPVNSESERPKSERPELERPRLESSESKPFESENRIESERNPSPPHADDGDASGNSE